MTSSNVRRCGLLAVLTLIATSAGAQIPQEGAVPGRWIWASIRGSEPGKFPAGKVYFRKKFEIKENGSKLDLDVTADDAYSLSLDGKPISRGTDWHVAKHAEVTLPSGFHTLAAEVTNDAAGPAGFLLRGAVTPLGQVAPVHTDASWRVSTSRPAGDEWKLAAFDDSTWSKALDLGPLETKPWTGVVFESGDAAGRFRTPKGFRVTAVASPTLTGSVVAMNFDEQGRPCVSAERGPISRLIDKNQDGTFDETLVIAPQMSNCQGFTFQRGTLLAVGLGPQGTGIYRLTDPDGDGVFNKADLIRTATGPMQEHGPHAIVVGPEGALYYNNGNHAHLQGEVSPNSPSNIAYEGELLPHLPDPRGHATNILAPCGEILRSDDEGKTWSRISAGFRNHYDFAFNREGEAFTFDSDMEWDVGLPWYRPTRVLHAVPGAEFGSRNGSAVWPSYFYDGLHATLDVGRGSPTGVTFYQAQAFPFDYRDNFLICDWSQGRILAVELIPNGGGYEAKSKELVSGSPLNCTDIEVGPDGAVYFATGGRGTLGGLYKVEWTGETKPFTPITEPYFFEAIGLQSPQSSFSRARLDAIKKAHPRTWGTDLANLAKTDRQAPVFRARALDLLAAFGPAPDDALLATMAGDKSELLRRKAVFLLGTKTSAAAREAITKALRDPDALVRRRACESLVRSGGEIPMEKVAPLLNDRDRMVRYAARIAIEHGDPWKSKTLLLSTDAKRPQLEAMLALVRSGTLGEAAQEEFLFRELILWEGGSELNQLFDLLRLTSLTYTLGPRKPTECKSTPAMRAQLLDFFQNIPGVPPDKGTKAERELALNMIAALRCETARLLAFLNEPKAIPLLLDAQKNEPDRAMQVHYAYCLRAIKDGWTAKDRAQLWDWYEAASRWEGGYSFLGYLDFMVQDLAALLTAQETSARIKDASATPFPSRVLVRGLNLDAQTELIPVLKANYSRLSAASPNPAAASELRTLILERLGQTRSAEAHAALRDIARDDPGHRDLVARALCNNTTAADLPNLIIALDSRDPNTTSQVVTALLKLDAKPDGPEGLRNLLRLARRTGPAMLSPMQQLGKKWSDRPPVDDPDFDRSLAAWERSYREMFPKGPALEDDQGGRNSYTLAQLLSGVLQSPARKNASAERGKLVLSRARCLDCHKLGDQGQGVGPDLTTISSRFRPGEILESIVEPSKVISDQYKSVAVATTDGKLYNGMPAGQDATNLVLLLSDGTKVTIPKAQIDEQKDSKVSVMPEGLVNGLSYQDIADLLALFEAQPKVEVKK